MIFIRRMQGDGHVRSFVVDEAGEEVGWEIREEHDQHVLRRTWSRDWQKVESAMLKFDVEALELRRSGWREVDGV